MSGSATQRERHVASRFRRFVDSEYQLEGFSARAPISIGLRFAAQNSKNVPIISLVAKTVDVRWIRIQSANDLVIGIAVRKFPMLDFIHGSPANLRSSLLSENRQRPFHVFRIRQH